MEKSRYSISQEKIQRILIEMRLEAGLRQSDLAKMLCQPQSFISKYESGERILDFLELNQICIAMGFTIKEFIWRFENDNETK